MPLKPSVLITGASTGIGAVYADRFAGRGHGLALQQARDAAEMPSERCGWIWLSGIENCEHPWRVELILVFRANFQDRLSHHDIRA